MSQYFQKGNMESDLFLTRTKYILNQVFLGIPLLLLLFLFRLLELLHQKALSLAMQPGFILIHTVFFSNILLVKAKGSKNETLCKPGGYYSNNQQYGNKALEHRMAKVIKYRITAAR